MVVGCKKLSKPSNVGTGPDKHLTIIALRFDFTNPVEPAQKYIQRREPVFASHNREHSKAVTKM